MVNISLRLLFLMFVFVNGFKIGYGMTATTALEHHEEDPAGANASVVPEKLHAFLHCTLHDGEVAAAAKGANAGSEGVFLATAPMLSVGRGGKGGVEASTFVQSMMNKDTETKFTLTAVKKETPLEEFEETMK